MSEVGAYSPKHNDTPVGDRWPTDDGCGPRPEG
jgi:hypothetical protein